MEKETFTCDWVEGSGNGFKKCMANRAGVPNIRKALSSRLNAQTEAQLGTKFIFIASNFLAYHYIGMSDLIGAF